MRSSRGEELFLNHEGSPDLPSPLLASRILGSRRAAGLIAEKQRKPCDNFPLFPLYLMNQPIGVNQFKRIKADTTNKPTDIGTMKTNMLFSNTAPSVSLALAAVLGALGSASLLTQPLHAGSPGSTEWVLISTDSESTPVAREAHAMVYDERRGVVVLHGGVTGDRRDLPEGGEILFDTWEWNGTAWTRVSTTGPATFWHGMAYDASRGVTVLFGGRDPARPKEKIALRNTGEWNGESWMKIEGGQGEVGLYSPAMAYDPGRGKVIRRGGTSDRDTFDQNTTWEWDGQTWTMIANDGPRRGIGNLIYDAVRDTMVLFGGATGVGDPLPLDTWEFAGASWTRIATGGPGRAFTGFVFDSHRNVGVLYGGAVNSPGSPPLDDTWEWDGAQWTKMNITSPGPEERVFHAMAYDSKREKVVLFGGADCLFCAAQMNDTWEYSLDPNINTPENFPDPAFRSAVEKIVGVVPGQPLHR